ncbi:hypothetical protein HSX37_06750|uniref:Uncharacterized membrane protein YkvI n=1 Tax=Dendrosporobacter quercicolus TaxID=146817 RepID=A0A1G9W1U8_9FIRM|nr:hypothetical protein [Dendrosporobacter quercicolus]NSL47741.1 hypothetical protein [Dendrosporobacter quercicolus DSM 1736]SDM78522.1 Uncharacterized membrane protein YkvI [Dendrosporobacter quercicolus]
MENQTVSMKKVLIIAGAFCAFWIGSGFATGQEVLQFLSTSGAAKGITGAAIYSLLLGFFVYTLYGLGQKMQFSNPYDFFEYYCGKHIGQAYTWFSVVLMYGIYVVMLAGAGAIIQQYYGISVSTGTYCVAILALGTALLGVEKLIDIIGVIGPVKIVFVLAICIAALTVLVQQPDLLAVNSALIQTAGFPTASDNWLWSAILWAFLGLMFGSTFFVISGSACKSPKEARISGLLGVGAIFVAVVLLIIAEIVYLDVIKGQQVPTLAIAKHVAPLLAMVFAPVLMVCIYSSVASILLVVTRKFAVDKTKKFNLIAAALTVVGMFTGTLLPFDQLVNILYPISGYSGIALVAFIIYKEFINKNAFPFEKPGNEQKK